MSCSFPPWFEIAAGVTYAEFETTVEQCPRTYLRPDPGGSMMPWVLVVFLLLFHLPTCIIRAVRWESAQYLALGLAVLGIALTVQAYVSTALKPDEVLVWMPLTLVLDVGAMMQMVILIIEKHHVPDDHGVKRGGLKVLWQAIKKMVRDTKEAVSNRLTLSRREETRVVESNDLDVADQGDSLLPDGLPESQPNRVGNPLLSSIPPANLPSPNNSIRAADVEAVIPTTETAEDSELTEDYEPTKDAKPAKPLHPHALRYAFVALTAFILLLMLLVLQIYGLYSAVRGRRQQNLTVNWCSPAFRDFAVAVTTGNCEKYAVLDSSSNGIGCISLPGDQQRDWLLGTTIALSLAIFSEVFDFFFLLLWNDGGEKHRGVKMQRPWLTMFGGMIVLVVLITFGVWNANHLPKGVTEMVWIYRKEESSERGRVCRGTLNAPGLRGVMIGWMDGVFESWGGVYKGH